MNDREYDVTCDFIERRDAQLIWLAKSLKESGGKGRLHWETVPASLLKRVWFRFAKRGLIDINGVNKIEDRILTNIAKLTVSTYMMGHSSSVCDARDELEEEGFIFSDLEWDEWMCDYFTDNNGNWLLSDFALPRLHQLYQDIFSSDMDEHKIYAIDKVLNLVHQRSDLAALFIEGGSKTLSEVSLAGSYAEDKPVARPLVFW